MTRCCFSAASAGFMVFNLIYIYISLFFLFQFIFENFFILLLLFFCSTFLLVLLFSRDIFAKDTCNNNVILDSSNRPLEPQENKR